MAKKGNGISVCGILGGNIPSWDYKKGIAAIRHRGPDAVSIKKEASFTLAFARLSVIDLSDNAMQPMSNREGNVTIVYNGEIYGYHDLRRELEKQYFFCTSSDTEVILNAYLAYGDSFIDRVDGMYAIAILDEREGKLKLFRDRAGIKPLYYYAENEAFAFSSELKAFQAAGDNRWENDYTAIYDYLFYGYIPAPKTVYKNCSQLLPGHKLVYDICKKCILSISEYWDIHVNSSSGSTSKIESVAEEFRHLLQASVKEQLIADVPVGTFLSGGIDSSIVTYESNRESPDIQAFTIGFWESKYDESKYAKILAEKEKLNLQIRVLESKDVSVIKSCLRSWYDEPFSDTSAYPFYLVSKQARKSVTVALSGDGGDELFGGYTRYRNYCKNVKNLRLDSVLISRLADKIGIKDVCAGTSAMAYLESGLDRYLGSIFHSQQKQVERYRKKWRLPKDYDPAWHLKKYYHKELPPITRMRYLDFKTYLPGDILTKVDRASMANSLECRVPILSRKIIEFAFSLSDEMCAVGEDLKRIMKIAYRGILPNEILYRKKRGFSVPPSYIKTARTLTMPITLLILREHWRDMV